MLARVVGLTPGPDAMADARRRVRSLFNRLAGRSTRRSSTLASPRARSGSQGLGTRSTTRTWAKLTTVKADVDPDNMFAHGIDLSA